MPAPEIEDETDPSVNEKLLAMEDVKGIEVLSPLHISAGLELVTTGAGFTSTASENGFPAQPRVDVGVT